MIVAFSLKWTGRPLPPRMANADIVAFNIAAFIATLFLLEFGADKFIDHTAIVARRINVSQAVIGLLTAGAEWEEVADLLVSDSVLVSKT